MSNTSSMQPAGLLATDSAAGRTQQIENAPIESAPSDVELLVRELEKGPAKFNGRGSMISPGWRMRMALTLMRRAATVVRELDRDAASERAERQSLAAHQKALHLEIGQLKGVAERYAWLQRFLGLEREGSESREVRVGRLEALVSDLSRSAVGSLDEVIQARLADQVAAVEPFASGEPVGEPGFASDGPAPAI